MDAERLHRDALVIDGLVYHCDGWTGDLRAGGIDAINVTACHFEADFAEACVQIARWQEIVGQPGSEWRLIERAADFDRARSEGRIGAILGWQNTRPIADRLDRLYFFHKLGLRIMQPTYNYRNFLGDGCLEDEGAGLSSFGRDAIKLMNQLGIAIDLSHVGYRTAMDVIALSEQPVLVTHANPSAITPLARNKPDDLIRALVEKGGLIGASIYGPMCWNGDPAAKPAIADYIRQVEYLAEVAGIENVSFGTDLGTGANLQRIAFERATPRRWVGIDSFNRAFGESIPEALSGRLHLAPRPAAGHGGARGARLARGAHPRLPRREFTARARPHLGRVTPAVAALQEKLTIGDRRPRCIASAKSPSSKL